MSKSTFLGLTGRVHPDLNVKKLNENATNPILAKSESDVCFEVHNDASNINIVDDKTAASAINDAENDFNPDSILDEYEITKDDLKYATGEQLASLYFEADYSDDKNYSEHNAMLITLLANATTEQIQDFMGVFEKVTQNWDDWDDNYNFSYENLGKQLLYASRAEKITGKQSYNDFLDTVSANPDLFPNYNDYVGIVFGNQL